MVRPLALVAAIALIAACSSGDAASLATPVPTQPPSVDPSTTEALPAGSSSTTAEPTDAPAATSQQTDTTAPTDQTPTEATEPTADATTTTTIPAADRPFDVFVPSSYDGSTDVPLVVLLHGYNASGALQDAYFRLQPLAEQRGFLYVHPDGITDPRGSQFWNATDSCCNLFSLNVDDSAYLIGLIRQVQADYRVDPHRIFLIGHSNGGFMSYRMGCDHADTIAAIVSVSGATFVDSGDCQPSEPVSVLEIHGTADDVIAYDGSSILGRPFPSAPTSVSTWATYNGCGAIDAVQPAALDLEPNIDGNETSISGYGDCPSDGAAELWTVEGGAHSPQIGPTFFDHALDFLFAHPKS